MNQFADKLLDAYQSIYASNGHPDWAAAPRPTIPFVGTSWVAHEGVLVYASAENFSFDYANQRDTVVHSHPANRHRADFERWKLESLRNEFPRIHLQPATDGGLQIAAAFVRWKLGLACDADPASAIEWSAFANFSKFAVRTDGANVDRPRDVKQLTWSLPYVAADLEILAPSRVLLPGTILSALSEPKLSDRPMLQSWTALIGTLKDRAIPATQASQMALNRLAKNEPLSSRAIELKGECVATPWAGWTAKARRVNEETLWRFMAEIESGGRWDKPHRQP